MTFIKNLKPIHFFLISLILFLPAFFINLGVQPFIDDEGIRGLVALEMIFSNDFITPTLSGEHYFKKPPLYNWIIAGFFEITDTYNEFWLRFPAVCCLLFFTITIYLSLKKELGEKIAVITALMFLTSGRIIIYESLHGLIDICYSWVIYSMFIIIYKLYHKNKLLWLFILVYFLAAISYLMKGIPTLLFVGLTLLAYFISERKLKVLFSWYHFLGIIVFLTIISSYYYLYFSRNEVPANEIFSTLINESTRRTIVRFGIGKTLLNLLIFPFEQIYHFLPWSLFIVFIFRKDFIRVMIKNKFVKFNALIFIVNIIVYWTSPEVFPRYILMLIPLFFTVIIYFYDNKIKSQHFLEKGILGLVFPVTIALSITLLLFSSWLFPIIKTFLGFEIKYISIFIALALILFIYFKIQKFRIFTFVIFLLIFRIGFNWFVIPKRHLTMSAVISREEAKKVGKINKNKKLYTYWPSEIKPHPYYGKIIFKYNYLFYLTSQYGNVIEQKSKIEEDAIYLVKKRHYKSTLFEITDTLYSNGINSEVYLTKPLI
ncbi:MAG: ArnT family glycosyltransferase [Thiohalospira sp.]